MSSNMRLRTKDSTLFALVALCLFVTASVVEAQETRGEVLVVLAKEEAGTIDPALANVAALRKPPFNAFRSMKVLSRPPLRLNGNTPVEISLPNGRRLRLVLEQTLPDGRFRVRVSINRPNQTDYLPLLQVIASPGEPFFVAGQSHEGGTLVVGISLGEKPQS